MSIARRVGELDEGHPVGGDRADRVAGQVARQHVPAVEDHADARVVGAAHDLPGVAVVGDVPAPGERLEADLDAEAVGDLAELAQVRRRPVDAAERRRRDVGADEDAAGAELVHQRELAPGALEAARALRLGHALEVAERLEGDDLEPVVADHAADLAPASPRAPARRPRRSRRPRSRRAAIAASFSGSAPPSDTVAMENFMGVLSS